MIICQIRKRVNGPKSELYHGVVAVACPNTLESIPGLRPSGTGSTDTGNYQWCSESKVIHPKYYLKKGAHQSHLGRQQMGWFLAD